MKRFNAAGHLQRNWSLSTQMVTFSSSHVLCLVYTCLACVCVHMSTCALFSTSVYGYSSLRCMCLVYQSLCRPVRVPHSGFVRCMRFCTSGPALIFNSVYVLIGVCRYMMANLA